jgi:alcohol dehydrogenase (NADP+)
MEMELHPCFQHPALFEYVVSKGMLPIGYCPIGSPNRPARDTTADDVVDMEQPQLLAIAEAHGVHPAIICLKWAMQRGQVPIPFSIRETNYENNLRAAISDPLTENEMKSLATIDKDCRLIKGQVFLWEGAKDWHDLWDES